ncbi:L-serine ammonia-lyase, iron-sulfur-dependent, subunit alpha [Desulfoluna spongiiphila]|uniref:L-serine ammonia-lyase, iron-sulfur-dependent, subunit alpha n=1 Tax=Desulfoluna spongiiphila TaxID=419481 RepID=UPI0012510E18|nr:L-serine ammonia-lyase, iron-sulfur-dependent, subunit alpha [Desulfoluna spongiiphila]VVS91394.1 serine dehydratase beta chain [Desulfoluna spongiiphila]
MESLRELYRTGVGPSSSHTMGPRLAAEVFAGDHPEAASFRVTLFASLAATGKGHLTDVAVTEGLAPGSVEIIWRPEELLPGHPNGMLFEALDKAGNTEAEWLVYSTGGGAISETGMPPASSHTYDLTTMEAILAHCRKEGIPFWQYVEACEGEDIWDFLREKLQDMMGALDHGLATEGVLPGVLGLTRKAWTFHQKAVMSGDHFRRTGKISAYALAVSEENAAGGTIVTAPTCGACGVLPAVVRYLMEVVKADEIIFLRALATAGLIGNLIKFNASISGAEVGCQGEVGTACAMAAGAAAQILGGTVLQVEYAAEMGLEHHLGLTCDPVAGLVQIPCIERNAFAATRAMNCADYALFSDGSHFISFDEVVRVMRETGHDLPSPYRETAEGGLARAYSNRMGETD